MNRTLKRAIAGRRWLSTSTPLRSQLNRKTVYSTKLDFLADDQPIPTYRVMDTEGQIIDAKSDPKVILIHICQPSSCNNYRFTIAWERSLSKDLPSNDYVKHNGKRRLN